MSVASSDVYVEEKARRTVTITVNDGSVLEGSLVIPKTRSIAELLNSSRPFFEFESREGERIYLSKAAIRTIQTIDCNMRTEPVSAAVETDLVGSLSA